MAEVWKSMLIVKLRPKFDKMFGFFVAATTK